MKRFIFKCKKPTGDYIEIGVVAKNIEKAEKRIENYHVHYGLIPVEYLGWEAI